MRANYWQDFVSNIMNLVLYIRGEQEVSDGYIDIHFKREKNEAVEGMTV